MQPRKIFFDLLKQLESSLVNIYSPGEKHRCYGREFGQLLEISNYKKYKKAVDNCFHLLQGKEAVCNNCLWVFVVLYDVNYPYHLSNGGSICRVSCCTTMKKHQNLQKLDECSQCFTPGQGPVSAVAFRELLLILKRVMGFVPKDVRKLLYRYCREPLAFYIRDCTIHSVFNVRAQKQDMIRGHFDHMCPKLIEDDEQIAFFRIKYAWWKTIRENPQASSFEEPPTQGLRLMWKFYQKLYTKMGFQKVEQKCEDDKIYLFTWDPANTTTMCESSLLKIDQTLGPLVYE